MSIEDEQQALCRKYGVAWIAAGPHLKVGIARNVDGTAGLLNGLRHPPAGDTTGWYIWTGETFSDADDFFEPLHVHHLVTRSPAVLRFLGLAPGWRFLLAGAHVDVWEDRTLLNV